MKTVASSTLSLALLGAASAFAPSPNGASPSSLAAFGDDKYERVPVRDVRDVVGNRDSAPPPEFGVGDSPSMAGPDAPRRRAPRKSEALPFRNAPAALDGSLAGDFGFDPLGFAGNAADLAQYREAEVKHARLAMLAAAGWPLSELWDGGIARTFGMDPLLDDAGRVPSVLNGGLGKVSLGYWAGCLALAAAVEAYSLFFASKRKDYAPGDLGFDPLGFYPKGRTAKDAKDRKNLQLSEIKHGRLAMIAITAFAFQEFASGTAVVDHASVFFRPIMQVLSEQVPAYYIPPEAVEGASTVVPAVQETVTIIQETVTAVPPPVAAEALPVVSANVEAVTASAPMASGSAGDETLQREIAEATAKIADLEDKLARIQALTR